MNDPMTELTPLEHAIRSALPTDGVIRDETATARHIARAVRMLHTDRIEAQLAEPRLAEATAFRRGIAHAGMHLQADARVQEQQQGRVPALATLESGADQWPYTVEA